MIRKGMIIVLLLTIAVLCAGCWDRTEINDIALMMASSIDLEEDGRFTGTVQIAVPAREIGNMSANAKPYFIETGSGINVQQMSQKLQPKLSRKLFLAHRRVIFIGEKLARHGIEGILDHYSRNPSTRLRTFILVVKGGEGRDALAIEYPLEFVPTEAVREMEKLVGGTAVTIRELLNAASAQGIQPVMAAIELKPKEKSRRKTFSMAGTAVFKDLKLKGYLDPANTQLMLWVTGKLRQGDLIVKLPEGEGNFGVNLISARRTIKPSVEGGKAKFSVHLKGEGALVENNTNLDLSSPQNLQKVETLLERQILKNTKKMIAMVQKKYGSDIFGFGEELHKNNNRSWQQMKENWNRSFAEADISVGVDFDISRTGMTGPSTHLKENEIIK